VYVYVFVHVHIAGSLAYLKQVSSSFFLLQIYFIPTSSRFTPYFPECLPISGHPSRF
jgi:hypothetical protein